MTSEISSDQIEIIQEFIQESHDMIEQLEPTIIELGQRSQGEEGADRETMNAIFRLFHSMKGSAGFLELNNISQVAHAAENLLDLIRSDKIRMVPAHVDLLCQSCDFAKEALDYVEEHYTDEGLAEKAEAVKQEIERAMGEGTTAPAEAPAVEEASAAAPEESETAPAGDEAEELHMAVTPEMVQAFVQEADELLQSAEQGLLKWAAGESGPEDLAGLFRDMHSFKGNCGFFNFADLETLSHQMESVLDVAKSGGRLADANPAEQLLKLLDVLREGVGDIAQGGSGALEGLSGHLNGLKALHQGEEDRPQGGESAPGPAAEEQPEVPPLSPPETEQKEHASEARQPAPAKEALQGTDKDDSRARETGRQTAPAKPDKTKGTAMLKRQDIRVDLGKLDNLINLIGELVIAENMVIRNPDLEGMELGNFQKASQHMSKLVRELQEVAMVIRMIPVSGLFRRMIRLVHDLSAKAGKKVDLKLVGEETEVDKTVVEMITDPLVHLLRNALDHGLESPEDRKRSGKSQKGTVTLSAYHEEGQVWISVADDGRGLDREKLLAKAVSKGLVEGDGSDLTDKEVYTLIFHPGFSTADKITDISGRGVGMDVVKQNLDKIKGRVDVDSKPGLGTVIKMCIPLTLAIIDGMLVRVGGARCILPILSIRESFCPSPESITITPDGGELVRVRKNFFPVVRLHDLLDKEPDNRELDKGILIILEHHDRSVCLFVDEILGQQQTVIKGLSDYIGNVRLISGCTILGNGEICLILDVGNLVEMKHGKLI